MPSLPVVTMLPGPWRAGRIIAHRGSRITWPENTMLAFGGGLDAGAHHLETDLHLTADGHVVCFHDDILDRTTNGTGPVSAVTLEELRRLDAGHRHCVQGGFPFRGRGLKVPTLGEVLATFPDVGVVVDLKQDGLEDSLVLLLNRMQGWQRVIIASFSEERLSSIRAKSNGRALTSAGPDSALRWWRASRVGRTGPPGPVALQLPRNRGGLRVVDRRLVRAAHAGGLAVHVWTINQAEEMRTLWEAGVDAIITDRSDVAARVLDGDPGAQV